MDDTEFDLLCEGLSVEEAKRMRKILVEWCDGDENGFPVQLGLLTRAQWRVAATIPRSVNDSRKLIEQHLAQYRQETADLVKNLSVAASKQSEALKEIVAIHADKVDQASVASRNQLLETQEAAKRIRNDLDAGVSEWNHAKAHLEAERKKLEAVCQELDNRVAWRQLLWFGVAFLLAFCLGLAIGPNGESPKHQPVVEHK